MKQLKISRDITVFYPEVISTFNNEEILDDVNGLMAKQCQKIIFNLKNTRYIDSSGINLLLTSQKRVGAQSFRIAEAGDKVKRLLMLSEVGQRLRLYENESQAANSLL